MLEVGLTRSRQPTLSPRPRTLPAMHSAAPILHCWSQTGGSSSGFRPTSHCLRRVPGRVAIFKPAPKVTHYPPHSPLSAHLPHTAA